MQAVSSTTTSASLNLGFNCNSNCDQSLQQLVVKLCHSTLPRNYVQRHGCGVHTTCAGVRRMLESITLPAKAPSRAPALASADALVGQRPHGSGRERHTDPCCTGQHTSQSQQEMSRKRDVQQAQHRASRAQRRANMLGQEMWVAPSLLLAMKSQGNLADTSVHMVQRLEEASDWCRWQRGTRDIRS